jgi:hypothetical protein
MKPLLLAPVLFALTALAAACGGEEQAVGPTPVPSPKLAPWLQGQTRLVPLDVTTANPPGADAWFAVNPDTGQYKQRDPIGGRVPRRLAGNRYAVEPISANLAILDAAARTLTDIGPGWDGEISPDGRWAAIIPQVEGSTLAVVDVASGQRFDLGNLGKPVQLAWSRDGRLAVVRDGVLYVAQAPDWAPHKIGAFPYGSLQWSPDGLWIAFGQGRDIRLASPDLSQARTLAATNDPSTPVPLAWSPDGQKLAYGGPGGAYVVSIDSGEVTNVSPVGVAGGAALAFWSPDGSAVAFFAADTERQVAGIVVATADGSGARQITEGNAQVIGWTDEGIIARVYRSP